MATLRDDGVPVQIWPMPVEIPDPVRFEEDTVHHSYDPVLANRFWRMFVQVQRVFDASRDASFVGKCSPVHFFWGSFDLAVTRFSGRPAPPREGPAFMREAYSHEVISHGFWPGSGPMLEPAFYAYAVPDPPASKAARVQPAAASIIASSASSSCRTRPSAPQRHPTRPSSRSCRPPTIRPRPSRSGTAPPSIVRSPCPRGRRAGTRGVRPQFGRSGWPGVRPQFGHSGLAGGQTPIWTFGAGRGQTPIWTFGLAGGQTPIWTFGAGLGSDPSSTARRAKCDNAAPMDGEALVRAFEAGEEPAGGFHHAQHVHVAWWYLREHPLPEALKRFSESLRRFATAQGKPALYHETVTVAFLLIISERLADGDGDGSWDAFVARNPDLFAWKPSVLDRSLAPRPYGASGRAPASSCPNRLATDPS